MQFLKIKYSLNGLWSSSGKCLLDSERIAYCETILKAFTFRKS